MGLQVYRAAYRRPWVPILWLPLAIAIYAACLLWAFPGYLRPLVPYHPDLYLPTGLLNRSVTEVLTFPRPVSQVFLQLIGLLGVPGSIAAVIVLVLGGVVAMGLLARQLMRQTPHIFAFCCYGALLFAHPQFYFQHRHDVPAALSYLLLLVLAAAVWRGSGYAVIGMTGAALALTKETYYVPALILVLALGRERRWRLAALVGSIEAVALLYNLARYTYFLKDAARGTQTYAPSLHPLIFLSNFGFYVRELLWPFGWVVVIAVLGVLWRDRSRLRLAIVLVCAGLAAFLPHAALPQHLEGHYAWVGAPLVFAPVLLVTGQWWKQAALVAVSALVIATNAYRTTELTWLVQQEQAAGRIYASLNKLDTLDARHVLVTGLRTPYHPWLRADYIQYRFGPSQQWTVLVPQGGPQKTDRTVRLVLPRSAKWQVADALVVFASDGTLQGVAAGTPVSELVLVPALAVHTAQPDDFTSMLRAGVELLEWGWPERAEQYLKRAVQLDGTNPYGHFFLGRVREQLGDPAAARQLYRHAIELDNEPGNPAFREALRNAPS